VKLLVDEPGSDAARAAFDGAGGVRTISIAHVEASSALTRMRKGDRLTAHNFETALQSLERIWESLFVHAVTDAVIDAATEAAISHALRAYNALHLAGALAFAAEESIEFACWDRDLRAAAAAHGFVLVPQSL
jgi:predicted nucleic acid-binding protein